MADRNTGALATNRRARFDYEILDTFEAGIALLGSEIKSVRASKISIAEAYVQIKDGEAWLQNAHIAPYQAAGLSGQHDPIRPRKLLLHADEIDAMRREVEQQRYTIVPLRVYIKNRVAKVLIGVARGKRQADRRETIRRRDAQREMDRAMKSRD